MATRFRAGGSDMTTAESIALGLRWEMIRRAYFEQREQWDKAREATRCYERLFRQLQGIS